MTRSARTPPRNWAGNVAFSAERLHRPTSVAALRELVATTERLRVLGTGHSFNRIADSPTDLVTLADLPRTVDVDTAGRTARISGAVRYGDLAERLDAAGWALANLASLPHISVAGACATGTHGSGDGNQSLSAAVSSMDLVGADGELRTLSRDADGDRFRGAVVSLGALGAVVALTVDLVPSFQLRQYVYDDLPRGRFDTHWAEIFASGYSVSVFTDWRSRNPTMLWVKQRVDGDVDAPPSRWFGAVRADGPRHPIAGISPVHCTEQGGVPGAWYDRLPHFRLGFTPSSGEELQSEWLLPREHTPAALAALDGVRDRIAPVLQVCELRTVAADDLWLSPATGRDSVGIHFTWVKDPAAVLPVIDSVQRRLAPFGPRPHWGKLFTTDPQQVRASYPRADDFVRLCREFDPAGTWRNEWLDTYLPG